MPALVGSPSFTLRAPYRALAPPRKNCKLALLRIEEALARIFFQ